VLCTFSGPVVFMEEDHYVAEDFLHILWLQQKLLNGGSDCSFCNQAHILSLGSYPKYFNHRESSNMVSWSFQFECYLQFDYHWLVVFKVDLLPWSSSKHNMGMAFNRSVWINFQQCSELFCSVDDYNWDWSLLHVAQQCLPKLFGDPTNLKMKSKFILGALVLKAPRVFHIGEWYSLHYCFTLAALLKGLFCFLVEFIIGKQTVELTLRRCEKRRRHWDRRARPKHFFHLLWKLKICWALKVFGWRKEMEVGEILVIESCAYL
jgi:alpha-1,6-mannosyl-glycoprotein beta-1,2-N-acetylglucosaminyltransferase